MINDLVKRLRERTGLELECVALDAADRIEKLELIEKAFEQNQQVWSRNINRIEQLEAALREIADGAVADNADDACHLLMKMARKALEGKDD